MHSIIVKIHKNKIVNILFNKQVNVLYSGI